ncbi:hypothetical protein, partial [Raoultella ornithinolytica]|uniref:hypothetical protein n=1 Tax=Raoultella ornithinolytica TaxID=54291 RepID=UPI00234FE3D2
CPGYGPASLVGSVSGSPGKRSVTGERLPGGGIDYLPGLRPGIPCRPGGAALLSGRQTGRR